MFFNRVGWLKIKAVSLVGYLLQSFTSVQNDFCDLTTWGVYHPYPLPANRKRYGKLVWIYPEPPLFHQNQKGMERQATSFVPHPRWEFHTKHNWLCREKLSHGCFVHYCRTSGYPHLSLSWRHVCRKWPPIAWEPHVASDMLSNGRSSHLRGQRTLHIERHYSNNLPGT